ncbi:hector [Carabus blaptoides fortunei]
MEDVQKSSYTGCFHGIRGPKIPLDNVKALFVGFLIPTSKIEQSFRMPEEFQKFLLRKALIVEKEKRICENITQYDYIEDYRDGKDIWCPPFHDLLTCWPPTKAGEIVQKPCPDNIMGWDTSKYGFIECLENGSWYRHPQSPDKPWANYTTCLDWEDFTFRQFINNLYIFGYSISLAAIIISLVIFFSFRTLKCTRIRIHIHLFISFALNNIMWLIWYRQVIANPTVLKQNMVWCQVLHVIIHYLMVANYLWMFCEGLHLHLALVVVFVKDEVAMKCFMVLGWVVPGVLVAVYVSVRSTIPEDRIQCWMNDSHTMWILTAPVCISLIASMVFLINVVRVLLTKLHPSSAHPAPLGMRKAVRATLILVPLFGLHHVLIPFRPDPGSPLEVVYQIVSAVLVSLQGFCVSCLFCFANQDVVQAVGARLRRLCPDSWERSGYTGAIDSAGIVANGNTQSKDVVV